MRRCWNCKNYHRCDKHKYGVVRDCTSYVRTANQQEIRGIFSMQPSKRMKVMEKTALSSRQKHYLADGLGIVGTMALDTSKVQRGTASSAMTPTHMPTAAKLSIGKTAIAAGPHSKVA